MHNTLALTAALDPSGANGLCSGAPLPALLCPSSSSASSSSSSSSVALTLGAEYHRPGAVALTSMKSVTMSTMALSPVNHTSDAQLGIAAAAPPHGSAAHPPPVAMPTMTLPPGAVFNQIAIAPQHHHHPQHHLPHQQQQQLPAQPQNHPPHPFAIPIGSLVKPFPFLSYGSFVNARADLATKIKGGVALAATRNSNKFAPY